MVSKRLFGVGSFITFSLQHTYLVEANDNNMKIIDIQTNAATFEHGKASLLSKGTF